MSTVKNPGDVHLQWFAKDDENDLTLEQIRAFIDANKERADVAEYLNTFVVEKDLSSETVNAYLETSEGKVLLQPRLDRYANIAIKTHDEKQAPVLEAKIKAGVNEGIRKLHPEETEEQKQLREVREDMAKMKQDSEAKELKNAILMEANARHLPSALVENVNYISLEHFKNAAMAYEKVIAETKTTTANEVLASSQRPNGSQQKETNKIDLTKLSRAELIEMEMNGSLDDAIK